MDNVRADCENKRFCGYHSSYTFYIPMQNREGGRKRLLVSPSLVYIAISSCVVIVVVIVSWSAIYPNPNTKNNKRNRNIHNLVRLTSIKANKVEVREGGGKISSIYIPGG